MFLRRTREKKKKKRRILDKIEKRSTRRRKDISKSMDIAYKDFGISYRDYKRYKLYNTSDDNLQREYLYRKALRENLKEETIASAMRRSGMTREDAERDIKRAIKEYKITYEEYLLDRFCLVPENERGRYSERIKAERTQGYADDNFKRDKESIINYIMQESGWDRDTVLEQVKKSYELTDSSLMGYAISRFWELPEQEQLAWFTQGYSNHFRKKYSRDNFNTRRLMFYKDLLFEQADEFLGRKWCFTATTSWPEFKKLFDKEKKIIYKPRNGRGGWGVEIYSINDETSLRKVYNDLQNMPFGVVESLIVQHPEMQKFSKTSVNSLRFVIIRTNDGSKGIETGKVHFVYGGMRMGSGDSIVDNLHSGGMMAIFDIDTGIITTNAVDHNNNVYEYHPETGEKIKGFQIPFFEEAKNLVERICEKIDAEGYIGWDIAITESGPIIIEGNNNPGADGLQIPYVPEKKGMKHIFDPYY